MLFSAYEVNLCSVMWFFQFNDAVSPIFSGWQKIVSNYFKKQGAKKLIDLFDYLATPYKKTKIY